MTPVLPNMVQRQIMQRPLSGESKTLTQLGVMAGEAILARMTGRGWIEQRGSGRHHQIKITAAGIEAIQAKIP